MTAIAFAIFSVLNKMKEIIWSVGPRRFGELVLMSVLKVEEKCGLKASATFFGTLSCWLFCMMYIGVLSYCD